jgi:magnesium transporter
VLRAARYSESSGWGEIRELESVSDLRDEEGNLFWARVDVKDLTNEDVELIIKEFDLPGRAVDAAVNARSRPKIETFDDVLFLILHELDEVDGQLEAFQIAAFAGDDYLLILHAGADRTMDTAESRVRRTSDYPEGPLTLLHLLMDAIVDDFSERADQIEDEVEEMEELVLEVPEADIQHQLYSLKQRVARFRRYVFPVSRLIDEASARSEKHTHDKVQKLFRDVRDHVLRVSDQIRNVDDLAQAAIDFTRAEHDKRLGENSRRLSAWAAIFAVATIIGGIYGMNFRLVPKNDTLFGFWFAIGLMVVLCGTLYFYFRAKKWL